MAAQTLIYISDVAVPNPNTYNVTNIDIDSSDTMRNERGIMTRNRVRHGATKIELAWILRSPDQASLLKLVAPAQVPVRFYDPDVQGYRTAVMYAGDKSCNMKLYTADMDFDDVLWECKFSLIEY